MNPPCIINDWNKLKPKIRSSNSSLSFRKAIIKLIQRVKLSSPAENKILGIFVIDEPVIRFQSLT